MSRQLLILRHAKSAWDMEGVNDFERPLAKRGKNDASRIGLWMKKHTPYPEYVVSSPAFRAKQTACIVAKKLGIIESQIHWDEHIYMADVPTLLKAISGCPSSANTVLLVGHNPGLQKLLVSLCGEKPIKAAKGKDFPTAALAQLILSDAWNSLEPRTTRLISLIRARDIQ